MFRGHSKGLVLLFATEMWERFAFYTMRALVVLYMAAEVMDGGLGWSPKEAISLNGWYVGTAYLTPIIGGYLSDRFLGQRLSAMIGAWLMAIGLFALCVHAVPAFYAGLGLMAVGNGFFKPCLTSILGQLYDKRDESLRESAYSIFYMGINVGGMLAGLAAGILLSQWGYGAGFACAGAGMLFAVALFWWGKDRYLEDAGLKPCPKARVAENREPLTEEERDRFWVIGFLFITVLLFIAAWEQLCGLITLFIDGSVDRSVGGWEIPTPWLANVNPALIILMAPVLGGIWAWLGKKNTDPSAVVKMGIGCFATAVGFLLFSWMSASLSPHWSWVVLANFFVVIGELAVLPISWAAVTKLAPQRYVSQTMGLMLGAIGLGCYLAGWIGSFVETVGEGAIFDWLTYSLIGMGVACFLANPLLKRKEGSALEVATSTA